MAMPRIKLSEKVEKTCPLIFKQTDSRTSGSNPVRLQILFIGSKEKVLKLKLLSAHKIYCMMG